MTRPRARRSFTPLTLAPFFAWLWTSLAKRGLEPTTPVKFALGIALDESVLPLSNIPAWLPPYVLDLQKVLRR